jgi:beta-lactam-binding protein with PASTA domain
MKIVATVLLLAFAAREPLTAAAIPSQQTSDGECLIPDVIGMHRADAERRLREADLVAQVTTRQADRPGATVIAQQPRCGPMPRDRRVAIVVAEASPSDTPRPEPSRGGTSVGEVALPVGIAVGAAVLGAILSRRNNDQATVPNLVNLPEGAVADTLNKARLRPGEVGRQASTAVPSGRVLSQTPAAGAVVAPGTVVNVNVSAGRPMTEVPNLAGLDWQRANERTTGARLRILVTEPAAGDLTGLTVSSQVPAAGTRVSVGAAVGVTLQAAAVAAAPAADALQIVPPATQLPADIPLATQAPPAQAPPVEASAAPAVDPLPAAPVAQDPRLAAQPAEAVVAQVLQPQPAPPGGPPPAAVVTPGAAAPAASTLWLWPLFLFLLLGVVPLRDQIRKRFARKPPLLTETMPPVPRLTCVPRLDPGRQRITSNSRPGTMELAYSVNGGTQRAWFDDRPHPGKAEARP